jgi:pimeloyl-ACP methyl ester carboxylesterase
MSAGPITTASQTSAFRDEPCDPRLVGSIQLTVRCGVLTVPENRAQSAGRDLELLVVRVEPPGDPPPDPMIALGFDMPWTINYPGVAPMAERVGREVIILAQRGSAQSDPSLVCEEIDALSALGTDLTTLDAADVVDAVERGPFLDSVRACHDRLADTGVDLAAYNLVESAADVEDLRTALGIDQYNLTAAGTSSRVAFEVVRRYPDHLRSVILDSPSVPTVDMFTEAVLGTSASLAALAEACAADPACNSDYPDLTGAMAAGMAAYAESPVATLSEADQGLLIDGATILRLARGGLSSGYVSHMPWAIHHYIKAATIEPGTAAANALAGGWPPLARGFVAESEPWDVTDTLADHFSHGLLFSIACHDQLPFVDRDALLAATADEPWLGQAFLDSPFNEVCDLWDVGAAEPTVVATVSSSIPTLLLAGRFDPFGNPAFAREAAETLPNSWVVEIPSWSHKVLSDDQGCALSIRNAWIDDPVSPPDTSCVAGMPAIVFSPE